MKTLRDQAIAAYEIVLLEYARACAKADDLRTARNKLNEDITRAECEAGSLKVSVNGARKRLDAALLADK